MLVRLAKLQLQQLTWNTFKIAKFFVKLSFTFGNVVRWILNFCVLDR